MTPNTSKSKQLFDRAQTLMPGGVNSPVRAFRSVGSDPIFIESAKGAELISVDGFRYVDYVGSWGPMIVGHAHPDVVKAIQDAATKGTSYGAPTEAEVIFAETIQRLVPSMQMMRCVSSGTEATMAAIRVARGYTKRDLVVKFEGCYHGGADYLLVKAGSGLATLGTPDSSGVPASIASTCAVLPYNDIEALKNFFASHRDQIAAVIVEPVVGNMGCVPPDSQWLPTLRSETKKAGSLLIFDEVMTGFRVALGGAQALYDIQPDLTCFGKIAGGGLPLGIYGGRRDVMEHVAPLGTVYQAGTLSGNPLAVAAGLATIKLLEEPSFYVRLEKISAQVEKILKEESDASGIPSIVQRVGSMMTLFFTERSIRSWDDALHCNRDQFSKFHRILLEHGVYFPPSQFEAAFVSIALDDSLLEQTQTAVRAALKR